MKGNQITVLLVDDHQVLRDGLKVLIDSEDDMHVIGDADSVDEALERLSNIQPDVIVLDLGMPGMSGLETIREIRRREMPCRIVVLSMHNDREAITQADETNLELLRPWIWFLYSAIPGAAWGSEERCAKWQEQGGHYQHPVCSICHRRHGNEVQHACE